jgi:hypothetical protein
VGAWLEAALDDWQWWFLLTEERVYHCSAGSWQFYSVQCQGRQTRGQQRFQFGGMVESNEAPLQLRWASVNRVQWNVVVLTGYSPAENFPEVGREAPSTLTEWIELSNEGS